MSLFSKISAFFSSCGAKKSCCGGSCHSTESVDLGLSVEDAKILAEIDERIVVGKILEIKPHSNPKVTKVRVTNTQVSACGMVKQILCGASNIEVGQIVPVATVGADLGGGFVISQRAIRGEDSHGMICAKDELGLTKKNDGIWVLPTALEQRLGTPLKNLV